MYSTKMSPDDGNVVTPKLLRSGINRLVQHPTSATSRNEAHHHLMDSENCSNANSSSTIAADHVPCLRSPNTTIYGIKTRTPISGASLPSNPDGSEDLRVATAQTPAQRRVGHQITPSFSASHGVGTNRKYPKRLRRPAISLSPYLLVGDASLLAEVRKAGVHAHHNVDAEDEYGDDGEGNGNSRQPSGGRAPQLKEYLACIPTECGSMLTVVTKLEKRESPKDSSTVFQFDDPPTRLQRGTPFGFVMHELITRAVAAGSSAFVWNPEGNAFSAIIDDPAMSQYVSDHFSHGNFSSLQRQLNAYGWRKLKTGEYHGYFFHPYFHRDVKSCRLAKIGRDTREECRSASFPGKQQSKTTKSEKAETKQKQFSSIKPAPKACAMKQAPRPTIQHALESSGKQVAKRGRKLVNKAKKATHSATAGGGHARKIVPARKVGKQRVPQDVFGNSDPQGGSTRATVAQLESNSIEDGVFNPIEFFRPAATFRFRPKPPSPFVVVPNIAPGAGAMTEPDGGRLTAQSFSMNGTNSFSQDSPSDKFISPRSWGKKEFLANKKPRCRPAKTRSRPKKSPLKLQSLFDEPTEAERKFIGSSDSVTSPSRHGTVRPISARPLPSTRSSYSEDSPMNYLLNEPIGSPFAENAHFQTIDQSVHSTKHRQRPFCVPWVIPERSNGFEAISDLQSRGALEPSVENIPTPPNSPADQALPRPCKTIVQPIPVRMTCFGHGLVGCISPITMKRSRSQNIATKTAIPTPGHYLDHLDKPSKLPRRFSVDVEIGTQSVRDGMKCSQSAFLPVNPR